MQLLETIRNILLMIPVVIGGWFGAPDVPPPEIVPPPVVVEEVDLGAQNAIGGKRYFLSGSGISSTQNTIDLTNFDIAGSNMDLTMTDFGDLGCGTLEPGNDTRQEFISFTGVTQNADDTARLTGVTRGLLPVPDYTASSTFESAHSGGSTFVISNSPPCFFEDIPSLSSNEDITGSWTADTPTAASGIAIKSYVDSVVNGGAVSLDSISMEGVAEDSFATSSIVYFDEGVHRWLKASAAIAASSTNVQLGIAQGASSGSSIANGVLIRGYDTTISGATIGETIYLSDTAGATSSSPGTISVILGQARSTEVMYFDPVILNMAGITYDNTFTGQNTFTATTTIGAVNFASSTTMTVFTADGTWTKPAQFSYIIVEVVGAGGGGGAGDTNNGAGGGGGGGGYSKELLTPSDLSATSSIFVDVGTTNAASSSFSSFLSATGGANGATLGVGGEGGIGSGGDINTKGGGGSHGHTAVDISGQGGDSVLGGGARGADSTVGIAGSVFGGGGSGSHDSASAGGAGGAGVVIVTEYFN